MSKFIDKNEVLRLTNNGLDIILHYLPQARDSVSSRHKKFKLRDEDDASCQLSQDKDKIWTVKDYGSDEKPRNGIQIAMEEEGQTNNGEGFLNTLNIIAAKLNLNIENTGSKHLAQPRIVKTGKKQDDYTFVKRDTFTRFELETLGGSYLTEEICKNYNLSPLESYTNKNGTIFYSTEHYPIFVWDWGEFQKIYQPLAADKQYRFFYVGKKPKNFIYGLSQTIKAKELLKEKIDNETYNESVNGEDNKSTTDSYKLECIIKCSGDRDALNVAALGYPVIWTDSEATFLTYSDYNVITKMCKKFYNLPDIDEPGLRYALKFALHYFKPKFDPVYNIYLPEDLKETRDFRGKPCKDVTDFFKYYKNEGSRKYIFDELVEIATPLRFWEVHLKKDQKTGGYKEDYEFMNTRSLDFLNANGFFTINDPASKDGTGLVKITDKFIEHYKPEKVASWIYQYMKSCRFNERILNMVLRTQQLKPNQILGMPNAEFESTMHGKDWRTLVFKNTAWKITADAIKPIKHKEVDNYIWKHKTIPHNVSVLKDPMLTVDYSKEAKAIISKRDKHKKGSEKWTELHREFQSIATENRYDLTRHDFDFGFLDYIFKTSYMHWKDVEYNGVKETPEQVRIQNAHVLNKLYALGHLCHLYKDEAKALMVIAMDGKESDSGMHEGGTGKSLLFKAPQQFLETIFADGQNPDLTEDKHLFGGATKRTEYLYIDDAHRGMPLNRFYSIVTGNMEVNPKHAQSHSIPFADSPKLAITTNNTITKLDQSTLRRILFVVFPDYFHKKGPFSEYRENRSPDMLYNQIFYSEDWPDEDWNKFYNLMAYSIQLYMRFPEPIEPPMEKVSRRNFRNQMGDLFFNWATDYFNEQEEDHSFKHRDVYLERAVLYENFMNETENLKSENSWTRKINSKTNFKNQIKLFASYHEWEFNPPEITFPDGRIRHRDKGSLIEFFYLKTIPGKAKSFLTNNQNVPF